MLSVSKIIIYPIKGLKGISLKSSKVLKEGLEHDRRWMLIDESGNFISQRTHPQLALFHTSIDGETITVSYDNDYICFSIAEQIGVTSSSKIWNSRATFYEVSELVSSWFSNKLNSIVRLVKQDIETPRIKNYSNREGSTAVSLADGYPILFIGKASMDLLNSKLKEKVQVDRFRANIIVNSDIPHIEDTWASLNIGSSQIEVIKSCARCQVVNIDQQSGSSTSEVLKTLSHYRKIENKVYFGANASCQEEGRIAIGDEIDKNPLKS